MRYLLAPIAAAIVVLAGCATLQKPQQQPPQLLGCRPSGADIQFKGDIAPRDVLLCYASDGTVSWKVGDQKAAVAAPATPATVAKKPKTTK